MVLDFYSDVPLLKWSPSSNYQEEEGDDFSRMVSEDVVELSFSS